MKPKTSASVRTPQLAECGGPSFPCAERLAIVHSWPRTAGAATASRLPARARDRAIRRMCAPPWAPADCTRYGRTPPLRTTDPRLRCAGATEHGSGAAWPSRPRIADGARRTSARVLRRMTVADIGPRSHPVDVNVPRRDRTDSLWRQDRRALTLGLVLTIT